MATHEQLSIDLAMSESEFETKAEDDYQEYIEPRVKSVVRGAHACSVMGCEKGKGIKGKGVLRQH